MVTNAARINVAERRAGLWQAYRHEIFKGRKQFFYLVVVVAPLLAASALALLQLLIKLFSEVDQGLPPNGIRNLRYDFGSDSSFVTATNLLFVSLGLIFNILVLLACVLNVGNEYRWNTYKMLATRQASRVNLVLSKVLFAFTLMLGVFISAVVAWFLYGLFLKFFYSLPFEINSNDLGALGAGLKYYCLSLLQAFILALAAMAVTYRFKSLISGLVCYFVYNSIDSAISMIGASAANNGYGGAPEWAKPFMEIAKVLNPFMLNSSVNRLSMVEYVQGDVNQINPAVVASTPMWWAAAMLVIYIAVFTWLAVYFFASRDLSD
jgi:ABC-type transport system involved in multi-copper enzyme maturation permease subunit